METSEDPSQLDLGAAIRSHRLAHRLTQQQLATRLGVTQQSVARWERGLPPRADLVEIIRAELEGESAVSLAEIYPIANGEPLDEDTRAEMRDAFLMGCVAIVKRGDRLPDHLMSAVAQFVGVPDAYGNQ